MKNSADGSAVPLRLVEDHVLTLLKSPNAKMDRITVSTHTRRVRKQLETLGQLLNVVLGLLFAPRVHRIIENLP